MTQVDLDPIGSEECAVADRCADWSLASVRSL